MFKIAGLKRKAIDKIKLQFMLYKQKEKVCAAAVDVVAFYNAYDRVGVTKFDNACKTLKKEVAKLRALEDLNVD